MYRYLLSLIIVISFQYSKSQVNDYLRARAFEIQDKTDSALLYYSKIIDTKPNEKVLLQRGNLFLEIGSVDKAIFDFERAERFKINTASFNLAVCYAKLKDTLKTISYLRQNLSSAFKVNISDIKMESAFIFLYKTNEWENLWLQDWYSKYDQQLGELRFIYNSGDWLGVINFVSDIVIQSNEVRNEMLAMRAKAFFEMDNLQSAFEDYNKAINTNKRNYTYFEGRAEVEMKLKNFKSAEMDFNKAIQLAPDEFILYKKRCNCRMEMGKYTEGLEDASLLLSLFPSDLEALKLAGITNYKLEKYIKALEHFNNLINVSNYNTDYYLYRARIYSKTGMISNAFKDYDLILEKDQNNTTALKERANLRMNNNNPKGACSDWLRAEKLGDIEAGNLRWQNCK
jgi:tetratricopeptide (TPR) repeat protein